MYSGGFRGGSGGSLEPPFGSKLFQFHGEMYEKSGKVLKTNPLWMDLNPPSRNPGSAPDVCYMLHVFCWFSRCSEILAAASRENLHYF